jgi:hypothetical protein
VDTTNWVTFTATVPDWAVPELSRHASELVVRAAATAKPVDDQFAEAAVRRAYVDVNYPHWRAFLKVLAGASVKTEDGCVTWETLCDTMTMDASKLSGVVGAAQKALDGRPPFERRRQSGKAIFCMRRDVALMIIKFARESEDESLRAAGEPG